MMNTSFFNSDPGRALVGIAGLDLLMLGYLSLAGPEASQEWVLAIVPMLNIAAMIILVGWTTVVRPPLEAALMLITVWVPGAVLLTAIELASGWGSTMGGAFIVLAGGAFSHAALSPKVWARTERETAGFSQAA